MIYAKAKTYGLESKVLLIQRYLDEHLPEYWAGVLHIYSVIYPTVKAGKVIPEVYVGNDEHTQIFFDDTKACIIAFDVNSRTIKGLQHQANIDIVFNVNLKTIHSNNLRETEKAIVEAHKVLRRCNFISNISKITETIKEVFKGYNLDDVNTNDLQPFYTFSFTGDVVYSETYDPR